MQEQKETRKSQRMPEMQGTKEMSGVKGIKGGVKFADWQLEMKLLAAATFAMSLALALKDTVFTNFANELGVQAHQLGLIESIREVPGLLTVFMAMLTYFITESFLAAGSIFILGAGLFIFSISSNFYWLILASFVYSIGFHLFEPLRNAMVLKMGERGEGGRRLGKMGSIASVASLIGMGSVVFMSRFTSPRTIFLLAMGAGIIGGLIMLKIPKPEIHLKKRTLVFRKRYRFYYLLTFLSGCRRHIFTIFAPFVLVNIYHVSLTVMAALMTVNQAINIYSRQRIGKLIDNLGERTALTINYSLLIFIFFGYAYVKSLPVLFLLYILDNVCFGFNMAITTYLHKICDHEDLGPSLAMGTTANHVAAIFIPVLGGAIWDLYGYHYAFIMGIVIVAGSLIITNLIKDLGKVY